MRDKNNSTYISFQILVQFRSVQYFCGPFSYRHGACGLKITSTYKYVQVCMAIDNSMFCIKKKLIKFRSLTNLKIHPAASIGGFKIRKLLSKNEFFLKFGGGASSIGDTATEKIKKVIAWNCWTYVPNAGTGGYTLCGKGAEYIDYCVTFYCEMFSYG